jgi:lipopolysaccharide/colanic/teichoic acid biosynthesis glycosyltransferase
MKRSIDIVFSAAGLLLLLPLVPVIALFIKVDSRGPVIFKQERIGRDFKQFTIYKFRTMKVGARKKGSLITKGGDSRVTKVGAVLRKYKIDELPQLLNVLKGDMSLVGPRPEMAEYVRMYKSEYSKLLSVRPGITDPASIKYSNEEAVLGKAASAEDAYVKRILPEKIRLSAKYVDERTVWTDIKLIFMTLARTSHLKH